MPPSPFPSQTDEGRGTAKAGGGTAWTPVTVDHEGVYEGIFFGTFPSGGSPIHSLAESTGIIGDDVIRTRIKPVEGGSNWEMSMSVKRLPDSRGDMTCKANCTVSIISRICRPRVFGSEDSMERVATVDSHELKVNGLCWKNVQDTCDGNGLKMGRNLRMGLSLPEASTCLVELSAFAPIVSTRDFLDMADSAVLNPELPPLCHLY